jgi:hypothetical protein
VVSVRHTAHQTAVRLKPAAPNSRTDQERQGRKQFFFEKKNQKTFVYKSKG